MADLGDTSYVGFSEVRRTPAQTAAPPTGYGLHPSVPASGPHEKDKGQTDLAPLRLVLPNVVRATSPGVVYAMRGRDPDCPSLTYRYWRSTASPDLTGSSYTGPKCGANPLVDIVVLQVIPA